MIDRERILEAHGATVLDKDGNKIGTVTDVYLDQDTKEPEWMVVRTGLFGMRSSFVPLAEATMVGNDIQVPFDKEMVKKAPNIEEDGDLTPDEERELYEYYGIQYPGPLGAQRTQESAAAGTATEDAGTAAGTAGEEAPPQGVARVRLVRYVVVTRR
jgi:sporulation protein YlmC with PRC-barrel domain